MVAERKRKEWSEVLSHYDQMNAWLQSLILDPEGLRYLTPKSPVERWEERRLRMERMHRLLGHLDNPEEDYQAVHITGTSGKGSVATMTANLLMERNSIVGLHTSPYVQVPNEKLILNGKMISPSDFSDQLDEFKKVYDRLNVSGVMVPKYGEVWTALVHFVFSKKCVDWGVIEVGVGGRYDASNIINSQVSVINNVDYDHLLELGPTLEDIAWHKAGVIKPGKPVVTAITDPDLLGIVRYEASKNGSQIYIINRDFRADYIKEEDEGIVANLQTPFGNYNDVYISLHGRYQAENAGVALTSAQLALDSEDKKLDDEQIRDALSRVYIAGRFETMQDDPLTIIDGAHNPAKIAALTNMLRENYSGKDITLIVGMLKSKDIEGSLKSILPLVHQVVATQPNVIGKPSMYAEEMADVISTEEPDLDITISPDVGEAIDTALTKNKGNKNAMLVITGSIYMLGQAREYWHPKERLLYNLEYQ